LNILTILTAFTVAFVMGIFITEIKVFGVISDTIVDLVTAMFMVMWVVFFLNVDYLKPVINEAIEQ